MNMKRASAGLIGAGVVMVGAGLAILTPVSPADAVLDVTPSASTPAYSDIEEDDPEWDCRTMGNHTCAVTMGTNDYVVTFNDAGDPVRIEYADAPEWGFWSVNPPVFNAN